VSDSYSHHEHARPALPLRVVRRLERMVNPAATQARDCRARAARLRMGPMVAKAIASGSRTLLELMTPADLPSATQAEEMQSVRIELRRLAQALYGRDLSRPGGQLKRNLLAAVSSEANVHG
jgi:hypothetical protein